MNNYLIVASIAVFVLGGIVGTGELYSRYEKITRRTASAPAFVIYVLLNGLVSIFAFLLIRQFRFHFGIASDVGTDLDLLLLQALFAVFGTAALLRSSLFVIRVKGQDVELGPSGFLKVLRLSIDQRVDRNRAMERARLVESLMRDVSFERAYQSLPTYCLAMSGKMLSPEDQNSLAVEITGLRAAKIDDSHKSRLLGLILANSVGDDVLTASVTAIASELKSLPKPEPSAGPTPDQSLNAT